MIHDPWSMWPYASVCISEEVAISSKMSLYKEISRPVHIPVGSRCTYLKGKACCWSPQVHWYGIWTYTWEPWGLTFKLGSTEASWQVLGLIYLCSSPGTWVFRSKSGAWYHGNRHGALDSKRWPGTGTNRELRFLELSSIVRSIEATLEIGSKDTGLLGFWQKSDIISFIHIFLGKRHINLLCALCLWRKCTMVQLSIALTKYIRK